MWTGLRGARTCLCEGVCVFCSVFWTTVIVQCLLVRASAWQSLPSRLYHRDPLTSAFSANPRPPVTVRVCVCLWESEIPANQLNMSEHWEECQIVLFPFCNPHYMCVCERERQTESVCFHFRPGCSCADSLPLDRGEKSLLISLC